MTTPERSGAARRPRTVRFWLALLVTASMVPLALVSAALLYLDYEHRQERLARDSIATARALVSAVDRDLAGSRMALLALASSPYLAADDLARFHAQAAEVQRDLDLGNIVLLAPEGRQLVNTLRPFGSPLPDERNTVLRGVASTAKPIITDLFVGALTGRRLVAVAVPVMRDGKVAYVLAAGIWPEQLAEVLTAQRVPQRWIATIFDSTGSIVARTREIERFLGRKGAPELVRRMALVREDSLEITTLEGIPVYASFSRSAESNWSVAIGIPRAGVVGELRQALLVLIAAAVSLLALSLVLASFIGKRIGAAIGALRAPAYALGRGEAIRVPRLALREPDEVGAALTQTSELLQSALHRAHHDPLTGLANRTLFEASVEQALSLARRVAGSVAILYVDLDGFKIVNDTLGHAAGDALLRIAAARLKASVRESDIGARVGGDEFAVLLPNTGVDGAEAVAANLSAALARPYELSGDLARVSASIGIAAYPLCASSAEELLHRADEAMYEAKESGGGWRTAAPCVERRSIDAAAD